MKPMLQPGDSVECVYAHRANGPGWSNWPLWVIIRDAQNNLRRECLQPDEQGDALPLLYNTAAELHNTLCGLVAREMTKPASKAKRGKKR